MHTARAEIITEGEKEIRMSDGLVHLQDCHEKNGHEIQTLHTHTETHRDMRSGVATAVNRQKPKMAENRGPIRPLPACPLSLIHI